MSDDKITKLQIPSKEIKEGSLVKLKSGGPVMTVARVKHMILCTYYEDGRGEFQEYEFLPTELELEKTVKKPNS